ncbi:hypothetical protein ACLOJK_006965 [Asimina triloba]
MRNDARGWKSKRQQCLDDCVLEKILIMRVKRGQKGFGICFLGHLIRLCPSGGLWVRKKTPILIRMWKRFNRHIIMVDSLLWFGPPTSSLYARKYKPGCFRSRTGNRIKALVGFRISFLR